MAYRNNNIDPRWVLLAVLAAFFVAAVLLSSGVGPPADTNPHPTPTATSR